MSEVIYLDQAKDIRPSDLDRLKDAAQAPTTPLQEIRHGATSFVLRDATADAPAGVYFIGKNKDGEEKAPLWICAPLHIQAMTRNAKSSDWGRLLEWQDADGARHSWAMPMELLSGDGSDARRELVRQGLAVAPGRMARELLNTYLHVWPVAKRARCVERLGWFGNIYVLPEEAIGANQELVVFQSDQAIEPALTTSGTAESWRDSVAVLAHGNSRIMFSICCALAPALADLVGEDSGGFHLRGASSSGKSTALAAAASVWGSPTSYLRQWRATANGLEGMAALHNDSLLILDEISQCDPREVGEAAYLLANGQGKVRASRTGATRPSARWRVMVLSAGEQSLPDLMRAAGHKVNAGQEIRLADIEADAGAGMGIFEQLDDQPTPSALSLALKDVAARHHGAVGIEWLRHVVRHRPELGDRISACTQAFVVQYTPPCTCGQVQRVARRFGLVAAAGEQATQWGLTGWMAGEATAAVGQCFKSWLVNFGGVGNKEERELLAQVRAFFETHGSSRFEDIKACTEQRIVNRAGYYRTGTDGTREYLVLPEVFKRELCAGYSSTHATKVLIGAGFIRPGNDDKTSTKVRLPGLGTTTRVYAFTRRVWDADD